MKKFFTTPIYYVNDVPHIGHAYNIFATDTLARFWRERLGEKSVFFLTGTDENSQKTLEAAQKAGLSVPEYLDKMANRWRETWEKLGISFDDFIRTTEPRHIKTVQEILQKIYDNGDIYKGTYKGLYCTGCEAFLKESDLDSKGHCPDHKRPPAHIEEENYFFRLSRYSEALKELFLSKELLLPEKRRNEMLQFIERGLEDISISRKDAPIGIPFPFDESHKVYVWVDALINYRSACPGEDFWEGVHHIIGKDIAKFHTLIWPAMLLAAGIKPPKQVFAHGFFTVNGVKMSKTLGNVISPLVLAEHYGADAVRVALLSSFEFGNDGDFSLEQLYQTYKARLAGGLGNLFTRVITLLQKSFNGEKPQLPKPFKETSEWETFSEYLASYQLKEGIDYFFRIVDEANQLINETQLWNLVKQDKERAAEVFAKLLQYLEILTGMARVLLPSYASAMAELLGSGSRVGEKRILFPPKEALTLASITERDPRRIIEALDEKVVVGRILEITPHPDPSITKVRVTRCEIAPGKTETILCGAANIEVGQIVPIATLGSKLPGDFEIGERTIAGVTSRGMICAKNELGLPASKRESQGIWVLPEVLKKEIGKPLKDCAFVLEL